MVAPEPPPLASTSSSSRMPASATGYKDEADAEADTEAETDADETSRKLGKAGSTNNKSNKAVMFASKIRQSLKKRRRAREDRTLSLSITDVRDEQEQRTVEALRKVLESDNLLTLQFDDYHVMLR